MNTRTKKLAFSSIMVSVSVALMLMSRVISVASYAIPAIAGMFLVFVVIEAGRKYALLSYVSVSLLSFILAVNMESAVLYVLFFGCYMIVKSVLEQRCSKVIAWICKFLFFNIAIAASWCLFLFVFGFADYSLAEYGGLPVYIVAFVLANMVFLLFDIGLSRVATLYVYRFRKIIRKIFR